MRGLKGLVLLAVSNLIVIRVWFALQLRGFFPRYWINLIILGVLVTLNYVAVRAAKISVSRQEAAFIRRYLLPICFLGVIFLGAINSLVTIVAGKGKIIPDYTNVVVGLLLVPLIVSILRRNWVRRNADGWPPSHISK